MTPRKQVFCTHGMCRLRVHGSRVRRGLTTCTACGRQMKSRKVKDEGRLIGSIVGEYLARALGFV
jgi:hypothetical protein